MRIKSEPNLHNIIWVVHLDYRHQMNEITRNRTQIKLHDFGSSHQPLHRCIPYPHLHSLALLEWPVCDRCFFDEWRATQLLLPSLLDALLVFVVALVHQLIGACMIGWSLGFNFYVDSSDANIVSDAHHFDKKWEIGLFRDQVIDVVVGLFYLLASVFQ